MLQARFVTTEATARIMAARLEPFFEEEGYPVSCFAVTEDGPWAVEVLFYDLDVEAIEFALRQSLGDDFATLDVTIDPLPDENWVAKSLEGLSPVAAGRFFVHGSHDRHRRRMAGHNIEIDANLAFGTGHHGTTWGCLVALDRILKRSRPGSVLDMGTGSGVLAFACAMAMKGRVLATDIDPVAVETARINAAANAVAPNLAIVTANGFEHPVFARYAPFDLVLANIIARPLAALAPAMARHLAPRATLVLSGLREEDGRRILAAYRPFGLVLERRIVAANWLTLILVREPRPAPIF